MPRANRQRIYISRLISTTPDLSCCPRYSKGFNGTHWALSPRGEDSGYSERRLPLNSQCPASRRDRGSGYIGNDAFHPVHPPNRVSLRWWEVRGERHGGYESWARWHTSWKNPSFFPRASSNSIPIHSLVPPGRALCLLEYDLFTGRLKTARTVPVAPFAEPSRMFTRSPAEHSLSSNGILSKAGQQPSYVLPSGREGLRFYRTGIIRSLGKHNWVLVTSDVDRENTHQSLFLDLWLVRSTLEVTRTQIVIFMFCVNLKVLSCRATEPTANNSAGVGLIIL